MLAPSWAKKRPESAIVVPAPVISAVGIV